MFVQDHHSLEELQRLTKALRLETGTQLVIDSSCVPVSTLVSPELTAARRSDGTPTTFRRLPRKRPAPERGWDERDQ